MLADAGRMRRYLDDLDKWRDWYRRIYKCCIVLFSVAFATILAMSYMQQWTSDMSLNWVLFTAYVVIRCSGS